MSEAIDGTGRLNEPAQAYIKLRTNAHGRTRRVLIPAVSMIENFVQRIPFSYARDIAEMKKELAVSCGADLTCPVTTRLHLRAICETAVAAHANGGNAAPIWRMIGADDLTARKVSGVAGLIRDKRRLENI